MILVPLFDLKFLNEPRRDCCRNFKSAALDRNFKSTALALMPLLGVRLELLLQGGELGEGRVRIGLPVAPFLARPLDEGGTQLRIPFGSIAVATIAAVAAAPGTARTLVSAVRLRTVAPRPPALTLR